MLEWVRAALRVQDETDTICHAKARAKEKDRVTRQELAAIFADDLDLTVLHKRTAARGSKPR
jgi:hypothetical protein